MGRRAAIIATGQTKHVSKRRDVNIPELISEAVQACLADAQMTMADVDAVVIGNMEHFEGVYNPNLWAADVLGAVGKHMMMITTGGTTGASLAHAGYYHAASGCFDRVLCVGWEKQSDGDTTAGLIFQADPLFERFNMAGAIGTFALAASEYMDRFGITEEQAAMVSVKNRGNACKNPHAHLRKEVSIEDVLGSRVLAYPIKLLDMCPTSDGACAVIVASEDAAKKGPNKPAWFKALATRHDQPFNSDLPMLIQMRTLTDAAREAYKQAGITDPLKEIDVAELYEPCTFAEMSWYEALGFCGLGQGGKLVESGATQMSGELPVNPSGGVISTNCIGATALIRVAEAAVQIMGKGGERQIDGVKTALATGFGGSWWTEITILEGD
ncbi:MAG TPA: thiolase family protein [bacterium]|nr:thiolase family protein [bacterium]